MDDREISQQRAAKRLLQSREEIANLIAGHIKAVETLTREMDFNGDLYQAIAGEPAPVFEMSARLVRAG